MRVITAKELVTGEADPLSGKPMTAADLEEIERSDRYLQLLLKANPPLVRSTAGRFAVIAHSDFIKRPQMRWIIPGVLPEAELAMMYGESGSGKSFLAYDMAAAITRGIKWNGRDVIPGNVCIVAAEGASGMRNRAEAYALKHPDAKKLPAFIADAPNLLDEKEAAAITKQLADTGPWSVIFFDTLSRVHTGNENQGDDMSKVLAHCGLIHRKTGALVCLIHHSGLADKARARGWSGTKAAMDAEIQVTRDGDSRAWKTTKQKEGRDNIGFGFRLAGVSLGVDSLGETVTSCVVEHCAPAAYVKKGNAASGPYELAVMAAVHECFEDNITVSDVTAAVRDVIPYDGEADDQRNGATKKAIKRLVTKNLLCFVEGSEGTRVQMRIKETSEGFE